MIYRPVGTAQQVGIINEALRRIDFPHDLMLPKLAAKTGRDYIPVDWQDLSRYFMGHEEADGHIHHHGGTADPYVREIEGRKAVLGLAWYAGRVTIHTGLVSNPTLAMEVFASEAAHMVDFFYMTDAMRLAIFNSFHTPDQQAPEGSPIHDGHDVNHGHSWFDVGGYYSWVGESFMDAYVRAFSDIPSTISGFVHRTTPEVIRVTREVLLPHVEPEVPTSGPEAPAEPTPTPEPEPEVPGVSPEAGAVYVGAGKKTRVYHDSHKRIEPAIWFTSAAEAVAAGYRACRTCKP